MSIFPSSNIGSTELSVTRRVKCCGPIPLRQHVVLYGSERNVELQGFHLENMTSYKERRKKYTNNWPPKTLKLQLICFSVFILYIAYCPTVTAHSLNLLREWLCKSTSCILHNLHLLNTISVTLCVVKSVVLYQCNTNKKY